VYAGRFGDAPFQRLYSAQNNFGPFWALYVLLLLFLPALLNPYMIVLPEVGLATLTAVYLWRGVAMARSERLDPTWRVGPLLGLLYFIPSLARAWGRLSARLPYASAGAARSDWRLRGAGRNIFVAEYEEELSRTAFLEGLRQGIQSVRLRPKASLGWEEADILCNSALFWRAWMVSYEAWGTFYVRLICKPRFARLILPIAVIVFALLWWSALAAAGAIAGFLVVLLVEKLLYERKIRLALTGDTRQGSSA
jgi:hypothetical protein